jgi:proteasome lid subunit RPN8/RPN11
VQEVEGLTVVLKSEPQKIRRRSPVNFTLNVTKAGQPVTDLEPYLGAPGHVVIISTDTRQFVHTHVEETVADHSHDPSTVFHSHPTAYYSGPDLRFTHIFMQEGSYKVWIQFGHRGKVITVAYNVQVSK